MCFEPLDENLCMSSLSSANWILQELRDEFTDFNMFPLELFCVLAHISLFCKISSCSELGPSSPDSPFVTFKNERNIAV